MNGGEVVSIFDKYGWPGVIAIVLITAFIIFFKYFQKTERETQKVTKESMENMSNNLSEKLTEKMSEQNEKIVSMISQQNENLVNTLQETNAKLIEHILNVRDKKHNDSLEYRKDISPEIIEIMKELRAEFKASRVSILEFHNSNINLTGLGFLSFDMKYERQEIGVPTINHLVKDRDISQVSWIMKQIAIQDKHVFIMNLLSDKQRHQLWEEAPVMHDDLVNKLNVKQNIFIGLYNYNTSMMIGIISIEYHDNKMDMIDLINENPEEYINSCAIYGSRLSQILTLPKNIS